MYVFYPASQVVGLTINFREIAQVIPFPARNPTPPPQQDPGQRPSESLSIADIPDKRKSSSPKRKSESPRTKSESCSVRTKNSESPVSVRGGRHRPILARSAEAVNDAQAASEATEHLLSLTENLRNLEVYRVTRKEVKRSRSFHVVPLSSMAGGESVLRCMSHPAVNDTLKNHHSVTFKLVKTGKTILLLLVSSLP